MLKHPRFSAFQLPPSSSPLPPSLSSPTTKNNSVPWSVCMQWCAWSPPPPAHLTPHPPSFLRPQPSKRGFLLCFGLSVCIGAFWDFSWLCGRQGGELISPLQPWPWNCRVLWQQQCFVRAKGSLAWDEVHWVRMITIWTQASCCRTVILSQSWHGVKTEGMVIITNEAGIIPCYLEGLERFWVSKGTIAMDNDSIWGMLVFYACKKPVKIV